MPIGLLLVVATGSDLFVHGLYRDTPASVAQALGQDAITLAVALPQAGVANCVSPKRDRF